MALNIAKANSVKLPSDCCWEWLEVIEYIRKTSSPTQVPLCQEYYGWGSVAARQEAIEWAKMKFEVENNTAMEALAGENAILWEELNLCRDKIQQLQNCATKEHMGNKELDEMVDSQEMYKEYEDYEVAEVVEGAEVVEKYELVYDVDNNVMIDPLAAAVDEVMFKSGSIGSC